MDILQEIGARFAEKGLIPDFVIRKGIQMRLAQTLKEFEDQPFEEQQKKKMEYINGLRTKPAIAIHTQTANKQHYEVPTEFFQMVMGRYMKYSCCYYDETTKTLDEAEEKMLSKYCEMLKIEDGMDILDVGCGWGSFSLFAAGRFPKSSIVSLSNSSTQKQFIDGQAKKRGLKNIQVITSDINDFNIDRQFDRIISIEMFEHMKNYEKLMEKIFSWLKPSGYFLVHHFSHVDHPYDYKEGDWMADNFFSGGTMPSDDLLLYFQKDLKAVDHWRICGTHYQKTAEDWLKNMDKKENQPKVLELFQKVYGNDQATKWINMWRLFFLAVSELFGYKNGTEWIVSIILFQKP